MSRQALASFFLLLCLNASAQSLHKHEDTPPPPVTLHSSADLVVVDVVVTDKSHAPVTHLKQDDFVLTEDGHPQTIASFEEHTPATQPTKPQNPIHLPPGTFTNYTPNPPGDTLNILLIDALNTPVTDQIYLRDQLRAYINSAKSTSPVAIFGLTDHLLLLQSFTSDPELLKSVINNKRLFVSPLSNEAITRGNTEPLLSDDMPGAGQSPTVPGLSPSSSSPAAAFNAAVIANMREFEAQQKTFQSQLSARMTLDAMNQIARYLSGLPGRKNLIWLSGAFPLNILPDGSLNHPFIATGDSEAEYRETVNLFTRAQIAVYPVDIRGNMTSTVGDVSQSAEKYVGDPTRFASDFETSHTDTNNEHLTMFRLAEDSGGHAFVNENDLTHAVTEAITTGSTYYTISYTPSNPDWNGRFRKIEIKPAQHNLTLAYRRGYYADRPNALAGKTIITNKRGNPVGQQSFNPMQVAMLRGAPNATQVTLKLRIQPARSAPEPAPVKSNVLTLGTKGPFQRYVIDLIFAPSDIAFVKTPDGHCHLDLDVLSAVYNTSGTVVNTQDDQGFADLTPQTYLRELHQGVPIHQEISVPTRGDYFLRVGIHDRITNRIGTIEIPISAVKNLPPA